MSDIRTIKKQTLNNFHQNVEKVKGLMSFDEILLDSVFSLIKSYREKANIPTAKSNLDKLLTMVSSIKSNGSLKENYRTINNQCMVLLVSYFGSAIGETFRKCFSLSLERNKLESFGNIELKLTIEEVKSITNLEGNVSLGDEFLKQKILTFKT